MITIYFTDIQNKTTKVKHFDLPEQALRYWNIKWQKYNFPNELFQMKLLLRNDHEDETILDSSLLQNNIDEFRMRKILLEKIMINFASQLQKGIK